MELIFSGIFGLLAGVLVSVVSARLPESMMRDTANFIALASGAECVHQPYPVLPAYALANLFPLAFRTVAICVSCALLSVLAIAVFGVTSSGMAVVMFTLLLVTLVATDLESHLLPDSVIYPLLWVGLVSNLDSAFASPQSAIVGAIAGYTILWTLAASFKRVTKRDGMGNGDFKLLAALGAWHGHESLLWILTAAIVPAVALYVVFPSRRTTAFAFGPYLAVAGLAAFYLHPLTHSF